MYTAQGVILFVMDRRGEWLNNCNFLYSRISSYSLYCHVGGKGCWKAEEDRGQCMIFLNRDLRSMHGTNTRVRPLRQSDGIM